MNIYKFSSIMIVNNNRERGQWPVYYTGPQSFVMFSNSLA